MAGLKLAKLPDCIPVKLTISIHPELNRSLIAYADAYREHYDEEKKVTDLIPAMLECFLASDKEFNRAQKVGLLPTLSNKSET